MPEKIKIIVKDITLDAELFDTKTGKAITASLPVETTPEEWGDELYVEIPVELPLDETATTKVRTGDIGYWPPGNALAIFFGPTPLSKGPEPVPASEVSLAGKILGDATVLRKAKGAIRIRIEKA